ncbi:metallophosphoesterase [Thermomonospora umbrina]|uniref:Calcineurin-like phosphoesterase family protein n=1 Tax=Thermomonospora umbrina TaxID=111806 RepID=A0A3D9SRV0_9ACTN|nr:metallophosphoesterase [Thermomonospora umbrina]REE96693.1 calcineurin-like phosphoesterase family protein [Thermomonospora umbrina]
MILGRFRRRLSDLSDPPGTTPRPDQPARADAHPDPYDGVHPPSAPDTVPLERPSRPRRPDTPPTRTRPPNPVPSDPAPKAFRPRLTRGRAQRTGHPYAAALTEADDARSDPSGTHPEPIAPHLDPDSAGGRREQTDPTNTLPEAGHTTDSAPAPQKPRDAHAVAVHASAPAPTTQVPTDAHPAPGHAGDYEHVPIPQAARYAHSAPGHTTDSDPTAQAATDAHPVAGHAGDPDPVPMPQAARNVHPAPGHTGPVPTTQAAGPEGNDPVDAHAPPVPDRTPPGADESGSEQVGVDVGPERAESADTPDTGGERSGRPDVPMGHSGASEPVPEGNGSDPEGERDAPTEPGRDPDEQARPPRPEAKPPGGPRGPWRARLDGFAHHRATRVLLVVVVGLAGGMIGMLLGGRVETPVGPADVALSIRPSLDGGTTVHIPPLGSLRLDSHWGPVRLEARLAELHAEPARRLIEDGTELDRLTDRVGGQVRHGIIVLAVRATVFAMISALLAGLLVFRSWHRALLSMGTAFGGLLATGLLAFATFSPQSINEPRYTGLLANAPQVVGDVESIVERFSEYRAQLARLVGNVSRLYAATSTLPTYEPDPSTLRIVHVSDIHLNPAAWDVVRSVSSQFQADLIIDTGDLTDHGSGPEERFVEGIGDLRIPYVFVRGNHDSMDTQRAVARQQNAIVLDNETKEVEGLRIYGVGDPRFTPDKTTRHDDVTAAQLRTLGTQQARSLRVAGTTPDLVVVHDPNQGESFSGTTPLVLSGHSHKRGTKLLPTGTRTFIQGSTGGAGLRGLEHEEPTPIELSVLYFNRATNRLQGWDDLRLGGLGLTSAQIERHLEPSPDRAITPPAPAPTTSPTPSRWPSLDPRKWPTAPPPTSTPSSTPPPTSPSPTGRR